MLNSYKLTATNNGEESCATVMGRRLLSLLRVRLLCLEFDREGPGDGSLSDIGKAEEKAPEKT